LGGNGEVGGVLEVGACGGVRRGEGPRGGGEGGMGGGGGGGGGGRVGGSGGGG